MGFADAAAQMQTQPRTQRQNFKSLQAKKAMLEGSTVKASVGGKDEDDY
jgi:hypothetical protein